VRRLTDRIAFRQDTQGGAALHAGDAGDAVLVADIADGIYSPPAARSRGGSGGRRGAHDSLGVGRHAGEEEGRT
jgi:hypothetical protein